MRARAIAHAVDTDVAVVKRLGSIASVQHHHELMPILHPQEDDLPFAMSLERVHGSHMPRSPRAPAADHCPMCEVLYVLQGAGGIIIDGAHTGEVVRSGDSILAPAGSVQVQPQDESEDEASAGTTFLRVVLPLRFALGERDAAELATECNCAAQQVTEFWSSLPTAVMSQPAILAILANATRDIAPRAVTPPEASDGPWLLSSSDSASSGADSSGGEGAERSTWHRARARGGKGGSLEREWRALQRRRRQLSAHVSRALRRLRHGSAAAVDAATPSSVRAACDKIIAKVSVAEAPSFQLPDQQNRLALVLDPVTDEVPFTFGVEMFPPGHKTTPHVHTFAHEMFFIVAGSGEAFCNGKRFRVAAGDTVVFPPGCEHGIDADGGAERLYCLELMLPNEMFSEFVRAGRQMDGLHGDDMCVLAAIGCR